MNLVDTMDEYLPYINTFLFLCMFLTGSFYAYNSYRQVALQRKEARNQIIFGVLTTAAGLLQAYYAKAPRDDVLERILRSKIGKPPPPQ